MNGKDQKSGFTGINTRVEKWCGISSQSSTPIISVRCCHQQNKIGEAIEVSPSPKVGVNGQIIVIFRESKIFKIVFFASRRALLLNFYRGRIGSKWNPPKIWTSGAFSSLRNKIIPLSHAHFSVQIRISALYVGILIVFFVLRGWNYSLAT